MACWLVRHLHLLHIHSLCEEELTQIVDSFVAILPLHNTLCAGRLVFLEGSLLL